MATSTFYPDAGSGGNSTDGTVARSVASEAFATIIAGAGNTSNSTGAATQVLLAASTTTDQYTQNRKAIATFLTSALGSDTVTAVDFSVYGTAIDNGLGEPALHVAGSTPGDPTTIANSDYGQCQTTSFGSVAYGSYSTSGYNDITLNASGIANIDGSGTSDFSIQNAWDISGTFGGTWSSSASTTFTFSSADTSGTTQDPKLTVTHGAAAENRAPLASVGSNHLFVY